MRNGSRGWRDPRARTAAFALAITLAIQVFTSLAATATSVLAPEIGRDLGLAPELIGVFVGLIYAGAMSSSLASGGFVERFGAIRVSQVAVLLCAVGIAMVVVYAMRPDMLTLLLVIAPIVIGFGYGPITPASSQILARTAPPSRMALTFSIKQTGVPVGAALAGALLPAFAIGLGWQSAFVAVAGSGVAIALVAQVARQSLDAHRTPSRALSIAAVVAPLHQVLRTPALRELAVSSLAYAALQVCLMSYLVVYLTESLGYSLVAAGFALTAANLGGIAGRILWGIVADHFVAPRTVLGSIGIASALCAWVTVLFSAGWPFVALIAVCAFFGMTAIGWTGVQLAEVARAAPAGQAGAITGASGFITFGGVLVGPPTFALVSALTGGYRAGFAIFGAFALASGVRLIGAHRKR
jgi:MFS family permease